MEKIKSDLEGLVACCEQHDKDIAKITGTPPGWRDSYLDKAREALKDLEAKMKTHVWVLREPSEEMLQNGANDLIHRYGWRARDMANSAYKAMIASEESDD